MRKEKTNQPTNAEIVQEILLTSEQILSVYEDCIDNMLAKNARLEREKAILVSLLKMDLSNIAPPWGNRLH